MTITVILLPITSATLSKSSVLHGLQSKIGVILGLIFAEVTLGPP